MFELVMAASLTAEPLEEIIVSGNRLGEPRNEVAAAVSSLSGDQLQLTPSTAIDNVLNQAPGVMLQNTNGQQHLTAIRSPVLTGGAGQGSFLFLEDGLPLRAAAFGNVNGLMESSWELASDIEIWRGPASAVYGANAVHGLVNVLHQRPQSGSVAIGSSQYAQQLKVQALLAEGYAQGYINRDDGWRDSTGVDQEKLFLHMPVTVADINIKSSLVLHRLDQQTAGFIRGHNAYLDEALIYSNPNEDAYRRVDGIRWKSDISSDASDWTITPYFRQLDSELLMHFLPSQAIENSSQSSLGVLTNYRVSLGRVNAQFGVDADLSEGELREEQLIEDVYSYTQGLHYDYKVMTRNLATYGQLSGDLSEAITWEAGLRYESMHYDYANHLGAGGEGRFLRLASREDRYDVWLPKLALRYRFNNEQSSWIRLSRGGRTPQASDLYRLQLNQTGGKAQVETLDNLEVGWLYKTPALDAEVVAFYQYKRGVFFRDANGYSEANGRTEHLGVEASVNYQLSSQWAWQATATYSQHYYRFNREIVAGPNTTEAIHDGNQVDTAPNWLGSQRLAWSPNEQWQFGVQWQWVGSYYMDASNQHKYDGHQLLSADLQFLAMDSLTLGLAVHNLTNERYADRADFAFGSERYLPGRPRTVSVMLNYKL